MHRYDMEFMGLDQTAFWQQMDLCFADLLAMADPVRAVPIQEELIPTIELNPAPDVWPDPETFLSEPEA
jgi:hypothetical protein